ncbi:hypothetical protein BDR26DRAFT_369360 [Obelidium mucronatum]|nr:hypothetical protein BDR26DRAFT_369360 [Obelidium mucronatum]
MTTALEHQKYKLEAAQLQEKQKTFQARLARVQKKQAATVAKGQRAASRTRERILIADHPVIKGDNYAVDDNKGYGSDGYSEGQSEGTSRSGGSVLSLYEQKDVAALEQNEAGSDTDLIQKTEAEKNSMLNKDTQVLSDGEKEIMVLVEAGTSYFPSILSIL